MVFTGPDLFPNLIGMNTVLITTVFLGLYALDFLTDWLLDVLNMNSVLRNRHEVPHVFRGRITMETHRKGAEYTLRRARFGLLTGLKSRLVLLAVLFSGAAGALDGLLTMWNLSAYVHGLLFLVISSGILSLADLPAGLYGMFVIEEEFGFNATTPRTYFMDMAKGIPLSLVLTALLLGGLYAARAWFGFWWWAAGWGFLTLFQLAMMVAFPIFIAPLFNKFEPLPEGTLKNRLNALAERCGFANRGIYMMDGSRRSKHSNAYFTGIGASRRIVLFDTLMETLTDDEIESVLAHEIGHYKHGHIRKRLISSLFMSLAGFAVIGFILNWTPLYLAFGFETASLHGLLFILGFFIGPLAGLLSPLGHLKSRKHEYQADRYAVSRAGGADPMKRALLALSRDNLSNLAPHPAYSFWHYSHPAPAERIAALTAAEESAQDGQNQDSADA